MSLAPITLTTDKSTTVINNSHRKLRQDESGLSITVTVLNEDNTAYNLTGKNLVFCENKQGNKIIIDNGKGDNSGKFNRNSDNDAKGIFTYVLQEDVYAASGKAWFEITDGTTVDSTKNFYLDVEKDISVSLSNNDYISSLKALETAMAGAQSKITNDLADMEAQIAKHIADTKAANEGKITQALKNLTDKTTAALSNVDEYTQKLNTLQSQWDSELQNIKTKASADIDSVIKAINNRYTNDFAKLQSDFANWQASTTQNYQKQVDDILAQLQKNGTDVANVQKKVDDTITKMHTLAQQFSNINFTKFLKPSDLDNYYTKEETDLRLAQAGKVKSVNGNLPDQDGDVHVPSYAPNLLLGTQSKPKTVDMSFWSANADRYSIDPSIDLSGQTVTASIKFTESAHDAKVALEYKDSTGAMHYPVGNIIPAGTTGYSTVTQVLPANVKNIVVRPSWANGTVTGTCTYSEAKLAVWKSAGLPPDMTWLPSEADKANTSDVYTKAEVNSKTSGTVVTAYNIANKTPTKVTDSYTNKWLVDQVALGQFADQINQLKGRQGFDAPDFNTLTESGVYYISNPQNGKNFPPTGSWGILVVFNGDSQRTEQIYFADDDATVFMRTYGWLNGKANWSNWNQLAWTSDITSLQNQISTKANASEVSNPNLLYRNPMRSDMVTPINGDSKHFDYYGTINWDFVAFPLSSFKKGSTLTFSGTVNITGKQATGKYRIAIYDKTLTRNYMKDCNLNSGEYDSATFTVNADSEEQNPLYLLIYSGELGKTLGNSLNANYVKLEKGTVATPWCPPYADYATSNDITTLQSTLNSINNQVKAIEAGYMKKPTVISKADYDKLSTKDPNTLYEITE